MLRFFATLLATGVGVLAATAWWSGDNPSETSVEPPSPKLERPDSVERPTRESDPEATRIVGPSTPEAFAEPKEPTDLANRTATSRPARTSSDVVEVTNDFRERAPVDTKPATRNPRDVARSVPPIPAPVISAPPAPSSLPPAFVAIPIPAVPAPIPAPVMTLSPEPRPAEVEETRIPEPAPFTEEFFEIAEHDDRGFYGEENVVFVEGDDTFESSEVSQLPGVGADGTLELAADESRIAMNEGRDASADRIRRLLDVYETLRSRR